MLGLAQSATEKAQWYIVEYKRKTNKIRILYRFKKESGEQVFPSMIKRSVAQTPTASNKKKGINLIQKSMAKSVAKKIV